jgi:hypothetical protein
MQYFTGFQKMVEDLIQGLISFAYNVFGSILLIWWRPLPNSAYLSKQARTENSRRIKSSTLLFVVSPLLVWVPTSDYFGYFQGLLKASDNRWLPYLSGVIAAYIAVDLLSRGVSYSLSPANKRQRNLDILRYCAAASFVLARIAIEFANQVGDYLDPSFRAGSARGVVNLTLLLLSLYPLICAAKMLSAPREDKTAASVLRKYVLIAGIPFSLLLWGVFAADVMQKYVALELNKKHPAQMLSIAPMSCLVRPDGAFAGVIRLTMDGDQDEAIPTDLVRATIISARDRSKTYSFDVNLLPSETQSHFIILSGGSSRVAQLTGLIHPDAVGWPLRDIGFCNFEPILGRVGLATSWTAEGKSARFVP